MSMYPNQIPPPPVDMAMPPENAIIAVICYALLAAFTLWTLFEARRDKSPILPLIMAGGVLTVFQEPLLAHVGTFWYPEIGPAPVLRAFNVSIPAWIVAGYGLYVGSLSVLLYRKMRAGMTAKQLWTAYFLIWIFNLGLELPGLNLHVYVYYGDQPFNVFGFPMCWAMTNVAIPMIASAVLVAYQDVLKGPRVLLILPLMPMMSIAGESATGLPIWYAMNSGVGPGGKIVAGLITLSFSLLLTYMISLKLCINKEGGTS